MGIDHRLYSWRFNYRRYFEIYSISFHLIFLRKVDGCWSLVIMRHIIHKFVNVYPLIAYSCEVAIHIIISWVLILESGPRWYGKLHSHNIQEQGNNYSRVDIIAFPFEVFKYLFKKLFFRQFFLKSIYFSSCKIPKNQESASLMVTNNSIQFIYFKTYVLSISYINTNSIYM